MSQFTVFSDQVTSGQDVETLTGNSGGAIPADSNGNINLLGDNTQGIDIAGSGNTLTASGIDAATDQKGVVELATGAETQLLADTTRALTASGMGELFAVEQQSGFGAFTGAGSIYTVSGTDFTLDRPGYGWINTKLVSWNGSQTLLGLATGSTHFIYIDSSGIIGSTTSRTHALYQNNIVLFEAWIDVSGTPKVTVVKENHRLTTNPETMSAMHDLGLHGFNAFSSGASLAISGTQSLQVIGTSEWYDQDLSTSVPDSAASPITFNVVYTNAGGKWVVQSTGTTLPSQYNNAGTPTAIGGTNFSIFDIQVSKDDIESSSPTYFAVMNNSQYNSLALANKAVSDGTYTIPTAELALLETVRIGIVIMNNTQIETVLSSKQTIGTGSQVSMAGSASLVTTDVTNFDGWLSGSDTNVQAALETLDDKYFNTDTELVTLQAVTAPSHSAGQLFYDSSLDAMTFHNSNANVALQVGEENWIKVINNSGVQIDNGKVVYLSGASGGFPQIQLARADASSTSQVVGVTTHNIANGATGYITTFGIVRGVGTGSFSGGDMLWLSATTAGNVTVTKPTSPNYAIRIGYVANAAASPNGTFLVNIENFGDKADISGLADTDDVEFANLTLTGISSGFTGSSNEFRQAGIQTTDATVTPIATITLDTNTMVTINARFNGFRNDYAEALGGYMQYTVRRVAGGAIEVSSPNVTTDSDSAGTPSVDGDVSGNDVRLLVQGNAGETWAWTVTYDYNFLKTNA